MAHLILAALGPLHITLNGSPVASFESDKVRALLIYLAMNAAQPLPRAALADLLWPELPERAARHNLSQALFNLRQAIGDQHADPPFLRVTRATVQFNTTSNYTLDTATFTALLTTCAAHAHRNPETCAACARRFADALALYRGDFLAQFSRIDSLPFEEWALLEREHFQRRALHALAALASYHERRSKYPEACIYARRQLELDPWNEAAHRQLMRMLALDGQRAAALQQYERCRQALAEGLGVEPEPETIALYRQIKDDRMTGGQGEATTTSPAPPPTRSPVHNFPAPSTPFIGREAELAQLTELLANPACRLLTIAGPGGVGKTRLALQAAERIDMFADGVYIVPLAALSSPEQIAPAILGALSLRSTGSDPPDEQLLAALRDRELLLILDSMEHLLADIGLVSAMLKHAPKLSIMVTSRERLNIHGEWVLELGGLETPPQGQTSVMEPYSAVELFMQSARRVRAGVQLTAADTAAIIRICQLVEGLPLAIELAATWLRALTCGEIAHEIESSIDFLATSLRDVPRRHRSMRSVFDQSWQLLTEDERRVLRHLSVFRGGFRREAARQVADASLTHLAALIDKSLLRTSTTGQYDLHELVRQYADMQLHAAHEERDAHDRHLRYFMALAEQAEPQLTGPDQETWLGQLEQARDNLRAGLQWAIDRGEAEAALRLSGALWRFWDMHGHFTEGRRWLEQALALPDHNVPPAVRLKAINGAGTLARRQSDLAPAKAWFEAGLALSRESGEQFWTAVLLNALGLLVRRQGDLARATALFEESLELSRAIGNQRGVLAALGNLGSVERALGHLARAAALQEECLAVSRQLGDKRGIADDLNNLAVVLDAQGNFERATALQQEGLELYRALGDQYGIALVLYNLGARACHGGAHEQARAYLAESLRIYQALGEAAGCVDCLEQIAASAAAQGHGAHAAQLIGAAEHLRAMLDAARTPAMQTDVDAAVATTKNCLDADVLADAWAQGRIMTLEQAIACALAGAKHSWAHASPLQEWPE